MTVSGGTPFMAADDYDEVRKRTGLSPIPAFASRIELETARKIEIADRNAETNLTRQLRRPRRANKLNHAQISKIAHEFVDEIAHDITSVCGLPPDLQARLEERLLDERGHVRRPGRSEGQQHREKVAMIRAVNRSPEPPVIEMVKKPNLRDLSCSSVRCMAKWEGPVPLTDVRKAFPDAVVSGPRSPLHLKIRFPAPSNYTMLNT